MPTRVEVHSTPRIALVTLVVALVGSGTLVGLKRWLRPESVPAQPIASATSRAFPSIAGSLLLPVMDLTIPDASLESSWSAALSLALNGQTEVVVEGGRVDVLTESYAIEVDRLEKWHEAIGQAAHYGLKTGKTPVAAIMVPSDLWPISPTTRAKLLLIDDTCMKQGIKLVVLHRLGA